MKRHHHHFAFTIIELLIAMSLTLVLMTMVNFIFIDTSNAVSRGIATGKIITNKRTISEQISNDVKAMIGPGSNGILAILNYQMTAKPLKDARATGHETTRNVRSDQLMFMYDNSLGGGHDILEPLAPGNNNSYSNSSTANFVRIWYGHILRTNPDGTDPASPLLGSEPNKYINTWTMGRQALFIQSGASSIHATGVYYNSPVMGYSGVLVTPHQLYMAFSDVTDFIYAATNGTTTVDSLIDPNTGDGINGLLYASLAATPYRQVLYQMMYGVKRLRANGSPNSSTFESWRIAQMHPLFMSEVSDIEIAFAADANDDNGDGAVDGTPDVDLNGDIIWYDRNTPPTWDATVYAAAPQNPNDAAPNLTLPGMNANCDYAFTWRHDYPDNWPYMIRMRYRLHDKRGEILGPDKTSTTAQVGQWVEMILNVNRN